MRLLIASLRKLVRRPASRNTLIAMAGLLAIVYLSVGVSARTIDDPETRDGIAAVVTFPAAYGNLAGLLVTFVGLAAAAWAGSVAGAEWSWNTFRLAVARGESRARYALVTFAAATLLLLVAWVTLFAFGVGLALLGGSVAGLAAGDLGDPVTLGRLPLVLAAGWFAVVLSAGIGFAVAFIARSQVAGIVAVVGLYFGEQFAAIVVPADLLRLAPMNASSALAVEAGRGRPGPDLVVPLVMTVLYLAAAMGAVGLVARRTEVA